MRFRFMGRNGLHPGNIEILVDLVNQVLCRDRTAWLRPFLNNFAVSMICMPMASANRR
jgi:hypothetical protein